MEIAVAQPRVPLRSAQGRWIITATALGSGMIFLDGTVVNVALPRIQSELAAPLSGLQWIVNSYTLFLAALLLLGGGLGDMYGRKMAFDAGLIIFTMGSVACGLAPNLNVLIAARAAQGVGGALLVPGSLAMIKAVIEPRDSARAIGLWAGLSGVTTAIGPLLGGYLVQAVSWRAIFFINVPFALLTLFAIRHMPPNRDEHASPVIDWPGALATVVGLGGMTYALIQGPQNGWTNPWVMLAIVAAAAGAVLFPLREAMARHPMVPLETFRSRNFSGANLATIGVYFSLSGVLLFLVLDLQQVQAYTPIEAGLALLPVTILLLLLSPRVGGLVDRIGARLLMTAGPLIVAVGFCLLMLAGRHGSYLTNVFPGIVAIGLGMSLFVTPLTATVMESVPEGLVGVASGVSNTLTRVASLLAVATLGLIVVSRFNSTLAGSTGRLAIDRQARAAILAHSNQLANDPIPSHLSRGQRAAVRGTIDDAYLNGFRWAMGACAILCLLSAGVSAVTIGPSPDAENSPRAVA